MTTLFGRFQGIHYIYIYKKRVLRMRRRSRPIKLECEKYKDSIDSNWFLVQCYADNHKTLCLITGRELLILFRPDLWSSLKRCLYGKIKFGMQLPYYDKGKSVRFLLSGGHLTLSCCFRTYRQDYLSGKTIGITVFTYWCFSVIPNKNDRYLAAVTWMGIYLITR